MLKVFILKCKKKSKLEEYFKRQTLIFFYVLNLQPFFQNLNQNDALVEPDFKLSRLKVKVLTPG